MFLILGASGNLSQALQESLHHSETMVLSGRAITSWTEIDGVTAISNFLGNLGNKPQAIFNAVGIIDPRIALTQLNKINFNLPCNLLQATNKLQIPLYTFGSIMERDDTRMVSNNYLASKRNFRRFIDDLDIEQKRSHLHLLVHTWYGVKKLPGHMFLGQIVKSLVDKEIFTMTSGTQMREYHHIKDDMKVVLNLVKQQERGIIEINHGSPVELRKLATAIYKYFNSMQLLNINSHISPEDESGISFYRGTIVNSKHEFRDQIRGVIQYIEEFLV